jgi:hypothetical protein
MSKLVKKFYPVSLAVSVFAASMNAHAAYTGICSTSEDVATLPPGHWCAVANSHARAVEKKANEYPDWNGSSSSMYNSFQGNTGFAGIMQKWSGAAFDSLRDRLLVVGGGHKGYGGNEIIAFSLRNLSWERLTDPVPYPADRSNGAIMNTDGTPISRHTYSGLAYLEHVDRLFMYGGSGWFNGYGVNGTWTYDLGSAQANGNVASNSQFWELRTSTNQPGPGLDDIAVYDPITKRAIYHKQGSPGLIYSYDFESDRWDSHSSTGHQPETFGVIDPIRHQYFEFNTKNGDDLRVWDIPANGAGSMTYTSVATGGDTTMDSANDAGIAFDSSINKIVAYAGGTDVFVFDADTNEWTRRNADSGNSANPGGVTAEGGIFGRFRYSKNLNVYVYVDSVDNNVYLYRLAPEPIRPAAPVLSVE